MIEEIVLNHLERKMNIPVHMEIPENPQGKYLVLEKTSGSKENHICTAMIAVQSYAPTLYECAKLNELAKKAMEQLVEVDDVCRVELNADYNYTDTATKRYRYQAVFDITHY